MPENLFRIFEITMFCFVVDICDLVHDGEAIQLTASANLFLNMNNVRDTASHGHHS